MKGTRSTKQVKPTKRRKLRVDWVGVKVELANLTQPVYSENRMARNLDIVSIDRDTSVECIEAICKSTLQSVNDYKVSGNLSALAQLKSKVEELPQVLTKLSEFIE